MSTDTLEGGPGWLDTGRSAGGTPLGLVLAWSADGPDHVGACALCREPGSIGRGGASDDTLPRLPFVRLRPGGAAPRPQPASRGLSRHQLEITPDGDRLTVVNHGRAELFVDGRPAPRAEVVPGQVLHVARQLVMLVARIPLPPGPAPAADHAFGGPDADGIVGESAAAWELRRQLAFVGRRDGHVLLTGPSGSVCGGNRSKAWKVLGLRSRRQLYRLLHEHDLG